MRDSLQPTAVITPLHDPPEGSVLGRIVAGISSVEILQSVHRIVAITRNLEEVCEIEAEQPSNEVVDYLARVRWNRSRMVEHKTFGLGTALYRKQLDNGSFAVVVDYGTVERTLVIEQAYWVTTIDTLLQLKMQKVEEFKFRGGSAGRTPDRGYVPILLTKEAEASLRRIFNTKTEQKFTQVTPEDVAWAESQASLRNHV